MYDHYMLRLIAIVRRKPGSLWYGLIRLLSRQSVEFLVCEITSIGSIGQDSFLICNIDQAERDKDGR